MNEASGEIKVLFFATLRDLAGVHEIYLDIEDSSTISDLLDILKTRYPQTDEYLATALVAINRNYADEESIVRAGDEIAIFPPVSGGSEDYPTVCMITADEIDQDVLVKMITLPTTGAACIFSGMVRGKTMKGDFNQTSYLEYEAYAEMAEEKMAQVAREIREKWTAVEGIVIVQRIGRLYPGTPTVIIGCSAAHRDTGVFDAARYGIDRLKQIVPIWKKEVSPDGETWIEGDYLPGPDE